MTLRSLALGTVVLLLTFAPAVWAASVTADQPAARWSTVQTHGNGLHATLAIDGFQVASDDLGSYLTIAGTLPSESPIPQVHAFVAAPNGKGVQANLNASGFSGTGVMAGDQAGLAAGVDVGDPVLFRGVRLYPLRVTPGRVSDGGEIELAGELALDVEFTDDSRLPVDPGEIVVTAEVERYMRNLILNIDEVDLSVVAPVGRLLIVIENSPTLISRIQGYIDWKRQQGYEVIVDSPTNTGSSTAIRSVIESHYTADNELPLDHVLLIGDNNGTVDMTAYNNLTDHWYTQLEGNDILGDVSIGRFSVQDANIELVRVVNKVLSYERDVDISGDTQWLNNAALTAGSGSGISTILTNQSIKWMLANHGVTSDTLWHTMPNYPGGIPQFIVDKVNAGAHWVNYRGYYGMSGWNNSYLSDFTNPTRLPVVITITCGTGDFASQTQSISEGFYRAGAGTQPLGAVASVGTATTSTHTRFNNIVDAGIYEASMLQNVRSLGYGLLNGKLRLWQAYDGTGDENEIQNFTYWNNLMGDPALRVWVGPPQEATVTHESEISWGQNYLDVDVSYPDDWPELIWATLSDDEQVIATQRIMADGHVRLSFDPNDVSGEMKLTVVGDDVVPYQADVMIVDEAQYVYVADTVINDGPGDDDKPNPGETVALNLTLRNGGSDPVPQRTATVSTSSPYLTIVNGGTFTVPALNAGESTTVNNAVQVAIAGWTPDGVEPEITVTVGTDMVSDARITIAGWTATSATFVPDFGDVDTWEPNQTVDLILPWVNVGSVLASGLTGTVSVNGNDAITIDDATAAYNFVPVNGTGINTADPFVVTAGPDSYPGMPVRFTLTLEDNGGSVDSCEYVYYLSDPASNGLVGPDGHGYWAIDNTDTGFDVNVTYNWMDIRSPDNRLSIDDTSDEDDDAEVVVLPFNFSYYNQLHSRITVSSNGTVSFGSNTTLYTFRNWPIPNPLGPPAMLAPNWEDHVTDNGGVYAYHDQATGRYILQWDVEARRNGAPQSFQVILFDPAVWPTLTGNGMIQFQYEEFSQESGYYYDNDYCTVGIESPDQQTGIQLLYWTEYTDGAAVIEEGRAILFTDDLSGGTASPAIDISPAEIEHVYEGSVIDQTITLSNVGSGALLWNLNAVGNEFIGSQIRSALGLPPHAVTPQRAVTTAEIDPTAYQARKAREEQHHLAALDRDADTPNETPVITGSGGPDAFGYTWLDSDEPDGPVFEWHDMYGSPYADTDIIDGDYDDGYFVGRELPFSFEFYGVDYNMVYVNTNGFLSLTPGLTGFNTYQNIPLPSLDAPHEAEPATVIAPFWDDLNPEEGGTIWFYSNDQDLAVITFDGVYGWGPRGGPYTYQVLLHADGRIVYQYNEMGTERLDECTIGIQNDSGSIGLTVVDDGSYVENGLAVRIAKPTIWFEVLDQSGLIPEGESTDAMVQIDGGGLPDGVYEGAVQVNSNDPDNPMVMIPLTLYVGDGNLPPVVSDIPDQAIPDGGSFATIPLDEYVTDPSFPDDQIQWTATGQQDLTVSIVNRVATISYPNGWSGSETVTFTATNPNDLSDSDDASFTVGATPVQIDLAANRYELISFQNSPTSLAVEDVFADVTGLAVVYDDHGGAYIPSLDINTIGDIDVLEGYRVFTTQAQTMDVIGAPVDPTTTYDLLGATWNWVGHPYTEAIPVDLAYGAIADQLVIVLNDDGEFYWPDAGINTLGDLMAGDGYMTYVREDVSFMFNQPVSASRLAALPDGDVLRNLTAVPDAPAPTGKPYVVRVKVDEELVTLGADRVELLDGRTVVGSGYVLPDRSEAVVIAWGRNDDRPDLAGFDTGAVMAVRVLDASGGELRSRMSGETAEFGVGPYASVAVASNALPTAFEVSHGYPNPFNPAVTVPVALPDAGEVRFAAYNVLGQQVFAETRRLEAGRHQFVFRPERAAGSGVYFLRVQYGEHVHQQKVVMLK